MTLVHVAIWFFAFSLLSFLLMAFDKSAARNGRWRVPERTLLLWAFLGGGIGAKLAQNWLRHKTRKQPFATQLNLALVVNAGLAVLLAIPSAREAVFATLLDLI